MDNKFFMHLSRHRVGYLVAALVLTIAGLSTVNTVPNFYVSNNSLTGNVGELTNGVVVSENNASQVYTTDDTVTVGWQSASTDGSVYLVPVDTNQKTIPIGIVQGQSFKWVIPNHIQTGSYYFGVLSNNALDRSDVSFTVINTADKTTAEIVSELQSELNAYSAREQVAQSTLADLTNQITRAESNLNALNQEVADLTNSLNEATAYYFRVKATLSVEEDKAQMDKIDKMQNQLNLKIVDSKNAKANVDNLKAQAQNTQATVTGLQAAMTGIQAKINMFQGVTTTLSAGETDGEAAGSAATLGATTLSTPMNDPLAISAMEYGLIVASMMSNAVTVDDLTAAVDVEESALKQLEAYYSGVVAQKRAAELGITNAQKAYDQSVENVKTLTSSLESSQKTVDDLVTQISNTRDEKVLADLKGQLEVAQKEVSAFSLNLQNAQNTQQSNQFRLATGKRINSALDATLNEVTIATKTVQSTLDELTVKLNEMKTQGEATSTLTPVALDTLYKPYALGTTPSADEINRAISTQQALLDQLNEKAAIVATQLKDAQVNISSNQADLRDALSKANELTVTLETYAKQITDLTAQISGSRDEKTLTDLENQLSGVQSAMSNAVNLALTTQTTVQTAQQRLASGLRVLSAHESQSNQLQTAIALVKGELSNLSAQMQMLSGSDFSAAGGDAGATSSEMKITNEKEETAGGMVEFSLVLPGMTSTNTDGSGAGSITAGAEAETQATDLAITTSDSSSETTAQDSSSGSLTTR